MFIIILFFFPRPKKFPAIETYLAFTEFDQTSQADTLAHGVVSKILMVMVE
jgi:hypothetical protein